MKRFVFAVAMMVCAVSAFAQNVSKEEAMKNLKTQSNDMMAAFKEKNIDKFIEYSHPQFLTMVGGKEEFKKGLQGMMDQFAAAGVEIKKMEVGEPTPIIVLENELQSSMVQNVEVHLPDGQTQTNESTLIAQSTDGGKSWVFVDASGVTRDQVKMFIPNLSDDIKIIATEAE